MAVLLACSDDSAVSEAAQSIRNGATLMKQAQEIHQRALTVDAHADIEFADAPSSYVGADGMSKVSPSKMVLGGLDAVVMSVAVGPSPRTPEGYQTANALAQKKLAAVRALAADKANNAIVVLTPEALIQAHEAGQSAMILSFQNALIVGEDVSAIDDFYRQGVRMFALTHMGHNAFADSSRPLFNAESGRREANAEHGGLSTLGRAAIEKFNDLGAIIDVSQLSKDAALEVMNLSRTPVVASHSNAFRLTAVSRNLSDEELDRLAETGGVIHIAPFRGYLFDTTNVQMDIRIRALRREAGIDENYLYPFELYWEINDSQVKNKFLDQVSKLLGDINLENMLDHLDYVVNRIGVNHAGIGTDFNHGSGIAGYEDASDSLNVTIGLLRRGYSAEDIEKIWGGNFMRVWRQAEAAAVAPGSQ